MLPLRILATGKHLPGRRVTAAELDREHGFAAGFTESKGGVVERWFAHGNELQSEIGAKALADACARANVSLDSLDLLIAACGVQEQALPSTACAIAAAVGLPPGKAAFDVNASCVSFVQALQVAASLLASNAYQRIAIVSVDLASRGLDFSEPEASLIFGDGAAAIVVERANSPVIQQGLMAYKFATFPQGRAFCEIRAGGTRRNPNVGVEPRDYLFRMDGKAVFKLASQQMTPFLDQLLSQAGVQLSDIRWVVPHQASHLGMAHLVKRLGLPKDRVVDIYASHGNQVAASMPTALHELFTQRPVATGDLVLMLGTAAGLSLGGAVLRV
jgi:3-oxoacyl-[acyl-carrier-protein] synthase III